MISRKKNSKLESQYNEQGRCCYYCKERIAFEFITRDHFNPVSKGHTLVNNKIFACRKCNSFKSNLTFDELKQRCLNKLVKHLQAVVNNNWIITEKEIDVITRCSKILKTVNRIILNNYTPEIIFT